MNSLTKKFILCVCTVISSCDSAVKTPNKEGFFPIKEYGKWGFINSDGKTIINCQFDEVRDFSEGLAAIRNDSLWGFIDTAGKIAIPTKYKYVSKFSDGLCRVSSGAVHSKNNSFIRKDGNTAFISKYLNVGDFNFGRAYVMINDTVCYINKKDEIIINTHCTYGGWCFKDGIAHVWKSGSTKYIDTNGRVLLSLKSIGHEDFVDGLACVQIDEQVCYIDKKGRKKIIPQNPKLTYFNFSDGLAMAVDAGINHTAGFIDTTGCLVIPVKFKNVNDFKEGLAAYSENGMWGFIDKKGKVKIKTQFKNVDNSGFTNGLCMVWKDHEWGYINHGGRFVWKSKTDFQYQKLDLVKWRLDTLNINGPVFVNCQADGINYPHKGAFQELKNLTLRVDTTDLTVYNDKYSAFKLYLINGSEDTISLPLQDGRIKIIQEALNRNREWQEIENYYSSYCGNSYYEMKLMPNEYEIYPRPIFKGVFATKLRFKLKIGEKMIYSNEFGGKINVKQFLDQKDMANYDIMVWTY
jgi:hypothetical protein